MLGYPESSPTARIAKICCRGRQHTVLGRSSFVLSTYKENMNVNRVAPGVFRRFYATAECQGRSVEHVRLADIVELIMLYCAQESITLIAALLQIFWQFANPTGLNPLPDFRDQVCATPIVTYSNPKATPAKEHRARQIESISSALMQCQKNMFKDPVILEIKGEHYVKVDCIFTTSTCPEAGGYDILFAGAHMFYSHFLDVRWHVCRTCSKVRSENTLSEPAFYELRVWCMETLVVTAFSSDLSALNAAE